MHLECLPGEGRKVLKILKSPVKTHEFILAGGTALALQIGHRLSEDLDFFTSKPFSTDKLFREITKLKFDPEILQEEEGTLVIVINKTKVSMMRYDYPFLEKLTRFNGIPVAGIVDIASMKIIAISQRGAKRDFIDLYFILQRTPFWKIAENVVGRFGRKRINAVVIGKALVYFADADVDPDPKYLGKEKPDWNSIKMFFRKNAKQMVMDLQNAKQENMA